MRCTFCGHPPERHTLDGGCRRCNCPRSLSDLVDELAPAVVAASVVATAGTEPIMHARQPCMYCNAVEIVAHCAICGATRETT